MCSELVFEFLNDVSRVWSVSDEFVGAWFNFRIVCELMLSELVSDVSVLVELNRV